MANKRIFTSTRTPINTKVFTANARNEAGGKAYSRTDEQVLAQYVVTGTLNGTYYANAEEQVSTILEKSKSVRPEFLAKLAVYAREKAKMKDTPALLTAVLATLERPDLLAGVFNRAINNQKQLRNFVQIIRSGKVGRKSMGTALKRLVQSWLNNQTGDQLFYGSVGNDPSLADVVKMVHVKPKNKEHEAFYGWLLGKKYNKRYLPKLVKAFEEYKLNPSDETPDVDFRMLTALDLNTDAWKAIARKASWNTIRMNLNTFQRHGCFDDRDLVSQLAIKLRDPEQVRKNNVFPYQLLTSYQATEGSVPVQLSNALRDAMEVATQNIPALRGRTAVCIDVSGSMGDAVTGHRTGSTTKTTCVDVAGLIAASILRKNPDAVIVPFDTSVRNVLLNPTESVMTNAKLLAINGGGTACHVALQYLKNKHIKVDSVIYVSDNQSWAQNTGSGPTSMAGAWQEYRNTVSRKAKLVCIDIQPYSTVQVVDSASVLNVGGFADSVFDVVANFINGDNSDFSKVIDESVEL